MKHLVVLTFALTISFSAWSSKYGSGLNHNCIHVISMADDVFYFKSDKDVVGANVTVYDYRTGNAVMSQVIRRKHTKINFHAQKRGDYVILISKDDFRRKYVYHCI